MPRRSKSSTKTATAPKSGKKSRPARRTLGGASLAQLTAEIERRKNAIPALSRKANDLRKQLASVELELKALGSTVAVAPTAAAPAKSAKASKSAKPAKSAKSAKSSAKATKSGTSKRGRPGKDGGPTLGDRIIKAVGDANGSVRLRDLVNNLSKSMGRDASKSFLVQVSSTIRRLVTARSVAQVDRGVYKSV